MSANKIHRTPRILGKMLGQNIGKDVIVAGNITKISASGNTAEFMTFDNAQINITLPRNCKVDTTGFYEVWGTVKSSGTMLASQCFHFDDEASKDFDPKNYNDLLVIYHANANNRWKLNQNRRNL